MAALSAAAAQLMAAGEWLGEDWLCCRPRTAVDVRWPARASWIPLGLAVSRWASAPAQQMMAGDSQGQ
jgi:hypothetical protein